MSLSLALNNSLSGMKTTQKSLSVLSQNVANANTPGYSRQVVHQSAVYLDDVESGVKVESVSRVVDQYLQRAVRDLNADVGLGEVKKDYYERLQILLGNPGTENNLANAIDDYFNNLQTFANQPDKLSVKTALINSAEYLTREISAISYGIEDLRVQADNDIVDALDHINDQIDALYNISNLLKSSYALGRDSNSLLDERDAILEDLSTYLDLSVVFGQDGGVTLYTNDGLPLIENGKYHLVYDAQASVQGMIDDVPLDSITVYPVDEGGNIIGAGQNLTAGGVEGANTTTLGGGKVRGLLDMRDREFVDILAQFDELTETIVDQINSVHNQGSGYPPIDSYTGTREVADLEENIWTGGIRIAVVDENGEPLPSVYADEQGGFRALDLDLSSLDTGSGAGSPSVQGIIDEINDYFAPPDDKATLNNINNVQLVAQSSSIAGSTFDFDLQFENISTEDATVTVNNVIVTDGGATGLTSALPAAFDVNKGTNTTSGNTFTVDFTGGGGGPYTLQLDVTIDDGTGAPTQTGVIEYTITDGVTGILNDRYSPVNATGDAQIVAPASTTRYLSADLVDSNGNPVASGESGFLEIKTTDPSYRVVIDSLDSSEGGLSGVTSTATNRGFSHYFGLNDFFVDNYGTTNSAVNMQVRQDLLDDPNKISAGKMELSVQPSSPDTHALYTYELGGGDNSIAQDMADLHFNATSFDAAGGLAATNQSIVEYTATVMGYTASEANAADQFFSQKFTLLDSFQERSNSISQVNIDEELGKTILLQNAYQAAARVISVTNELFESLLLASS